MQEEVENLVVHRTALETVFEMMGTEIEEAQAIITEFVIYSMCRDTR